MKTLTDVLRTLDRKGYRESFRAVPEGLRATHAGQVFPASDVQVHEQIRLETESDPDGQVLVLAVSIRGQDIRGTYVVPYGPQMPRTDSTTLEHLELRKRAL